VLRVSLGEGVLLRVFLLRSPEILVVPIHRVGSALAVLLFR
jgi:hypothetical protein